MTLFHSESSFMYSFCSDYFMLLVVLCDQLVTSSLLKINLGENGESILQVTTLECNLC